MLTYILFSLQFILPIPTFIYYYFNICKCISTFFIITAKVSALMINFNLSILLLLSSNIHKKIIHVPIFNPHHKILTSSLYIWTILHISPHYFTLIRLHSITLTPLLNLLLLHPTTMSGYIISITLIILPLTSSLKYISYHSFLYSHFILTFILLLTTTIHSSFCLLKLNNQCPPITTPLWLLPPIIIYIITTFIKYTSHTHIHSIIHHPHHISQINLYLPPHFIGKNIYLCSKHISHIQWHPFTISHFNTHNNTCSIILKTLGPWTSQLSNLPHNSKLFYHGPMLSTPTITPYYNNIFISTGLHLTTFSHLIIHTTLLSPFIIITPTLSHIQWIIPLIPHYNLQHLHIFLSQSNHHSLTSQPFNCYPYKPNFNSLLTSIFLKSQPPLHIYYSGNKNALRQIQKIIPNYKNIYKLHII
jgi:hypothetical protein